MQKQKAQQQVTASAILWKVTNLHISEKQVKFQIPLPSPKRHHKKRYRLTIRRFFVTEDTAIRPNIYARGGEPDVFREPHFRGRFRQEPPWLQQAGRYEGQTQSTNTQDKCGRWLFTSLKKLLLRLVLLFNCVNAIKCCLLIRWLRIYVQVQKVRFS
jgi:hypothetical protein